MEGQDESKGIIGRDEVRARGALITPSLPCDPPLLNDFNPARDMGALTAFNSVWNLTGQPAVTVPATPFPAGLPVGVQFVGIPFDERALLRIASAFEAATPRPAPPLLTKLWD